MGYNNNNSGMHFKRWSGVYGTFDDGREIDRAAINTRKFKRDETQIVYIDPKDDLREIKLKNVIDVDNILKNIIYISLKKKIDAIYIMNKCDLIMSNSDYVKKMQYDLSGRIVGAPTSYKTFLYLSLLSDELQCEISDFFIDNSFEIYDFIISIINNMHKKDFFVEYDDNTITVDCYNVIGIENKLYKNDKTYLHSRLLYFIREPFDDKYLYSVQFGDCSFCMNVSEEYLRRGTILHDELFGEVADFTDNVLQNKKRH